MEIIIALPFLAVPLIFPVMAGLMAKNFGRPFWTWFWIGCFLPFIVNFILLFLKDRSKRVQNFLLPLEDVNISYHEEQIRA
jgi:MFS family permease